MPRLCQAVVPLGPAFRHARVESVGAVRDAVDTVPSAVDKMIRAGPCRSDPSAKDLIMISRRQLLDRIAGGAAALYVGSFPGRILAAEPQGVLLNDAQSQLNPTRVKAVVRPQSID